LNQRHACGTGDGSDVLRNRSPLLVETYRALETLVKSFGDVELVKRDRYVLFRSKRIFADVVIMSDAVRLAIHLPRQVEHELFIKVVADRRHVSHVLKLRSVKQVQAMKAFLGEAYDFSIS
jgi:predicted transport protein